MICSPPQLFPYTSPYLYPLTNTFMTASGYMTAAVAVNRYLDIRLGSEVSTQGTQQMSHNENCQSNLFCGNLITRWCFIFFSKKFPNPFTKLQKSAVFIFHFSIQKFVIVGQNTIVLMILFQNLCKELREKKKDLVQIALYYQGHHFR